MPAAKKAPKNKVVSKRTTKTPPKKPTKKRVSLKSPQKAVKKTIRLTKTVKPRKKNTITNTFERQTKKPFSFPAKISLALIPAVNILPINPDAIAVGVARYAGGAFLVIGGLLTMFYAQALGFPMLDVTQMALVNSSVTEGSIENQLQLNEVPHQPVEDHQPNAVIDIPHDEPLTGAVPVVISVPGAAEVRVHAVNEDLNLHLPLGAAVKKSPQTWRLEWDTTKVPDGTYRLGLIVINDFGSYDSRSDGRFTIANNLTESDTREPGIADNDVSQTDVVKTDAIDTDAAAETDAGGIDPSSIEDISVTEQEFRTIISFGDKNKLSNTAILSVETSSDVESINLRLVDLKGAGITELGRAIEDGDRWRFAWNTHTTPNGEYAVFARLTTATGEVTTERFKIVVENEVATDEFVDLENGVVQEEEEGFEAEELTPAKEDVGETVLITSVSKTNEFITLTFEAPDADFIEVYAATPAFASDRFIGLAKRTRSNVWRLTWNTVNVPNGKYNLYAKARVEGKFSLSTNKTVVVENALQASTKPDQVKNDIKIKEAVAEVLPVIETVKAEANTALEFEITSKPERKVETVRDGLLKRVATSEFFSAEDVPDGTQLIESDQAVVEIRSTELINKSSDQLDKQMQRLATALRSGDKEAIQTVQTDIKTRTESLLAEATDVSGANKQALGVLLEERVLDLQLRTEQTERIIKERVGDRISLDTDGDGVTDVDEISLYNTDPLQADTDGDGFTDGNEVLSGYNPNDASSEATVVFESPKNSGVTRSDILEVVAITTLTKEADEAPAAVISGRALANSYITLYVFSNPTVVTVKTDSDGNWSYKFDKEIAEGEHEVYVGVTDNAGRIVAKSAPISFIRTAQAFEPIDTSESAVVAQVNTTNESFVSTTMLLLVASISIAAIGLVLIILGLHLQSRREVIPVTVAQNETMAV